MSLKKLIKPIIPSFALRIRRKMFEVKALFDSVKSIHPRKCPFCEFEGAFGYFGHPPRLDAQCPSCGSLERHRLFWLWFKENASTIRGPILHFAPEKIIEKNLRSMYREYSSADLFNKADMRLNIEQIDLPSESISTVICNHVLEHVNDRLALSEICRILTRDGCLVVSVPIIEGWEKTYEKNDIDDPRLRTVHFGQYDHIRYYGRDFRDRLKDAGFSQIEEITAEGELVINYGLLRGEKIFICRKH